MLKKHYKKILIAVVAAVASPAVFATDWTGGFIGFSVESNKMDTRSKNSVTYINRGLFADNMGGLEYRLSTVTHYTKQDFNDFATDGGAIAGYDWQVNNWVVGVELDLSASKNEETDYDSSIISLGTPSRPPISDSEYAALLEMYSSVDFSAVFDIPSGTTIEDLLVPVAAVEPVSVVTATKIETKNNYSLRFRSGYLVASNVLIYGVVGLATQDVTVKSQCFSTATVCRSNVGYQYESESEGMEGVVLGIGTEVMLNNHWSVRLEYNQVDYGNFSYQSVASPTASADPANPVDVQVDFEHTTLSHTQVDVKSSNTELTVVYKF